MRTNFNSIEFASFGDVTSVSIPTDRYSGRPRGFAFVEMPSIPEGRAAIATLNGKTLKNRTLTVDPARPPSDNRGGGAYRGRKGNGFDGGRRRRY